MILKTLNISSGWIEQSIRVYILSSRKQDSIRIVEYIYCDQVEYFLGRKFKTIELFRAGMMER